MNWVKNILIAIFCGMLIITTSCNSDENKAKQVVKEFCETKASGADAKLSSLYPGLTGGNVDNSQVDLENLEVSQTQDGLWKVEDGADHTFFIKNEKGKFIISDTKNIVKPEPSKTGSRELAVKLLGLTNPNSTDLETLKAYSMLNNGSDLINFLNDKYPQAKAYGIEVQNIRTKKGGDMGIYWLDAKATLKSGRVKPLHMVEVYFLYKDGNGNVVYRSKHFANLKENDIEDVESTADLNDYPNIKDVEVEIEPYNKPSIIEDIDLLSAFAPLNKKDYQDYLKQKNQ